MLVLLQVCGLVCTYVDIFMRTYDTTFHVKRSQDHRHKFM